MRRHSQQRDNTVRALLGLSLLGAGLGCEARHAGPRMDQSRSMAHGSGAAPAPPNDLAGPGPMLRPVVEAPTEPPRIDLFGAWPERAAVPFMSRPAGALTQHSFTEVGGDFDSDIASDGESLVFASTRHRSRPALYMKSVNGRAVIQLTSDRGRDVQPAFSPDGTRVAFASDRSGSWDIWALQVEGGRPVQLTRDEGYEVHPSWSPDGTRLAYCRITPRGGAWELWVLDLDRPGVRRFIGHGLFPRWSPAGDRIVYQRARQQGDPLFSIWTLDLVDGEPRRPTEIISSPQHALISPSWSPDGTRIVYASVEPVGSLPIGFEASIDRASEIWVVDVDGRNPMRMTEGKGASHSPTWSRDGRIYFASIRNRHENIWSVRPVGPGLMARVASSDTTSDPVKTAAPARAAVPQPIQPARVESRVVPAAASETTSAFPNRPPPNIRAPDNAMALPAVGPVGAPGT